MFLTALFLLVVASCFVWKSKFHGNCTNPFSKESMSSMKAIAAVIVVMVHFPQSYSNPLQDMIGSFAYIAVTLFFFASAYGMQFSTDHNQRYLKTFWRNRLASLLIPMFIVNLIYVWGAWLSHNSQWYLKTVQFNHYVIVLLEYCLVFYLLRWAGRLLRWSATVVNIILIAIVTVSSLVDYFMFDSHNWACERLGLVWGILAYGSRERITGWLRCRFAVKTIVIAVVSAVLGVLYLKFKHVPFMGDYLSKILLGVSLVSLTFAVLSRVVIDNGVVRWLSSISYPVYLSHGGVMWVLPYYLTGLGSGEFIVLVYIITFVVSTAVARLANMLVARLRGK